MVVLETSDLTVQLDAGATIQLSQDSPDSPVEVTAVSGTSTVTVGGEVFTVEPGQTLVTDGTPPDTSASFDPVANANGWNNTDVAVTLAASDEPSDSVPNEIPVISGVREIHHMVDNGPEVVTAGAGAQIVLADEGIHTITFFAIDNAGNQEQTNSVTVSIDGTDPRIEVGSPESRTYLTSESFAVDFSLTDELSGIDAGSASLDGVAVCNGEVIDLATLAGSHTFTASATDAAGNQSSLSVSFRSSSTPRSTLTPIL